MVGGFASEQDGELIKCVIFRVQTSENISCIKWLAIHFSNFERWLHRAALDFDGGASAAGCVVRTLERCGTDKRGVGA